jgi:hypothetical protein
MSRNPQKDQLQARQFIQQKLDRLSIEPISFNILIRIVLVKFPVSENMVKGFINKYYIEEGLIVEKEGMLHANKI